MKNLVKVLGIIAVIAVIGLGVGCSVDPDEQTRITITDLPEGFEGKYAAVIVTKEDPRVTEDYTVLGAAKTGKVIKSGVAEAIPLFEIDKKAETFGEAAKVKVGYVILMINENENYLKAEDLYTGISDSAITLGEGTFEIKSGRFTPDINKYVTPPTAVEDVKDEYEGTYKTTYKLGVNDQDEYVELSTTAFNIYEKTAAGAKDPANFLDFVISKWEFVDNDKLPAGYAKGFKFTGKINDGKPVTAAAGANPASIYGGKTAPGFVAGDIKTTEACMFLLFKTNGTFARTVFVKAANAPAFPAAADLITGNEVPPVVRVYTKQ